MYGMINLFFAPEEVTMTDETKQKILDAALKLFAKNGYRGTTTRAIAIEAGLNELTLFRRFGTKENLFDEVMAQNHEQLQKTFIPIGEDLDQKFENPKDFLEAYLKTMAEYFIDNFERFNLMVNVDYNSIDNDMGEFISFIGEFLKRNIKSEKIDHQALGIMINTFFYMVNLSRYHGRHYENEVSTEKFIDNLLLCIK